ncbi:hypothetical protein [Massilia sp. CF038]|uniref:hypothetical protein n=1 Tax=Massilia sp. CF038 TaxID=1881045 RepID=UPI001160FF00|nr:hypothetical protein [Massilia sp. CF038]
MRLIDQAADLSGFQNLREAYETALHWAAHQQAQAPQDNPEQQGNTTDSTDGAGPTVTLSKHGPAASPAADRSDAASPGSASTVFQQLIGACYHLLSQPQGAALPAWIDTLRAALADPALISLIARHSFEHMLVDFLANGWRPGKEKLLAAAAEVFNWEHDHRHLPQFGASGAIVQRAIDERDIFLRQPPADLEIDRKIIERLRSGTDPTPRQLNDDMAYLERMLGRFPHLMALSIDGDAVARWREIFAANGGVLKEIKTAGAHHTTAEPSFGFAPWGLVIMLLFTMLRACGTH